MVVHSSDPVDRLSVVGLLADEPQVRVLGGDDRALATVIVLVERAVGDVALSWIRAAWHESTADRPRCVVVTDGFRGMNLLAAVECGVAAVLPRRGLDGSRLVRSVRSVSAGGGHLPPALQGELLRQFDRGQRELPGSAGRTSLAGVGALVDYLTGSRAS
ncbi:hypothetical protein GCM10027436_46830 [Actinophytocola sediminis]